MLKKSKVIGLMSVLFLSNYLYAKEACISYNENKNIIVGLEEIPSDSLLFKKTKSVFSQFINLAKNNVESDILNQFSKIDGSYDYLKEELKKTQGKFSLYSGLKSYTVKNMFKWNNYFLLNVDYKHKNGDISFFEPLFCTNACQVSNVFSRPSEEVSLVSRFLLVRNHGESVTCPNKAAFEIHSNTALTKVDPVRVYFNGKFEIEKKYKLPKSLSKCEKKINKITNDKLFTDNASSELDDLIKVCSINTKLRSLIPIVSLSDKPTTSYLTIPSFIDFIKNASEVTPFFQFKIEGWNVNAVIIKNALGQKNIIYFPFLRVGEDYFFDWKYFNSGISELLVSKYFAKYVKRQLSI